MLVIIICTIIIFVLIIYIIYYFFLGSLYKANPTKCSFDLISNKMLTLTIDPNPRVRANAVYCLGIIYDLKFIS